MMGELRIADTVLAAYTVFMHLVYLYLFPLKLCDSHINVFYVQSK